MQAEAAVMPVQPLEQSEFTPVPDYIGRHRTGEEDTGDPGWRTRLGQIAGRAALAFGVIAAGTAGFASEATPAHAEYRKTIGSCVGPFGGFIGVSQTCVVGTMGSKDFEHHSEFVRNVEVNGPDAGPRFLEIWGDGFYYSKPNATEADWDINKFVASGTNICGAGTDSEGFRQVTCYHIDVQ